MELLLEIFTTLIAVLVSSVCLRHVYKEHEKGYKKEQQLKHNVIEKILSHSLFSNRKQLQAHLEKTLERHSLQTRLHKLAHYDRNSKALEGFIHRFKRMEATKHTLKDLGLCWGP